MSDTQSQQYTNLAKEFGCRFRIGRFGIKFLTRKPSGGLNKLVAVIPLDGWILDPEEVAKEIKERNYEL